MKIKLKTFSILLTAILLSACGKEDYVYPNLLTEMACLKTNNEGYGFQILTDDDTVWNLREGNRPDSLTSDSIYRVICRFAPLSSNGSSKQEATAYSFQSVISPIPLPESSFKSIHTDPVSIQSIWQSKNYLNMILLIKIKEKGSKLAFVDQGISANEDGTQTLTLMLYHNRNNDVEGYDQKYYLSIPLWHYQDKLQKGDQIVFKLNTYKEGTTNRTFTY